MLLGAGEMAELAVEHLISSGVKEIIVANRTFCNAVALSEKFNGKAVKFEEMEGFLKKVDIIISSTGATEFILTAPQIKAIMRSEKTVLCSSSTLPYQGIWTLISTGSATVFCMTSTTSRDIVNDNIG